MAHNGTSPIFLTTKSFATIAPTEMQSSNEHRVREYEKDTNCKKAGRTEKWGAKK